MSRTEDLIKAPIARLIAERFGAVLRAPDGAAREFPLRIGDHPRCFRAGLAYRLPGGGWVFIEDDDAVRAVHNVAKYWEWIEDQDVRDEVYLVHLVGPGRRDLARSMGRRVEQANPQFHHHVIEVADWEEAGWFDELARVLDTLTTAGGDGVEAAGPLREEPAIGMWKDREDLRDSTAWVRALRRSEWERR